jgi:polyphosphate glucokinase
VTVPETNLATDRTGAPPVAPPSHAILAIDVGGTKIKILASGQTEPRRMPSGPEMTPALMVERVKELAGDWEYEAISIGYPGQVGGNGPRSEPGNLGPGWVGFDFAAAFGMPVRIINDAAMQALGSYEGGRMLFLGLGTGLGSALIADNVIVPLELGQMLYRGRRTLGGVLSRRGLRRIGKRAWRRVIDRVVPALTASFLTDYIVLGGGNAKKVIQPPPGARLGNNLTAFRGGFRLWHLDELPTLAGDEKAPSPGTPPAEWRLI